MGVSFIGLFTGILSIGCKDNEKQTFEIMQKCIFTFVFAIEKCNSKCYNKNDEREWWKGAICFAEGE